MYLLSQSQQLKPVGFCIYCGAVESETCSLTREHVIPASLGGEFVLPKSSCLICAAKTGKIENYIGRNLMWEHRIIEGFRTSHKKGDRPKEFAHRVRLKDQTILDAISKVEDFPGTVCLPVFPMPSIYQTQFRKVDPRVYEDNIRISSWIRRSASWQTREDVAKYIFNLKMDFAKFSIFLAKMAHSFCYANFDEFPFDPLLNNIIVGKDIRYPYFIGSEYQRPNREASRDHELFIRYHKIRGHRYVCVRIRLLCKLGEDNHPGSGSPIYWVVAGRAL